MAIVKRQLNRHEKGNRNETWCYLASDTETGDVFVIEGSHYPPQESSEHNVSLQAFLSEDGAGQRKLKELIGTLIPS